MLRYLHLIGIGIVALFAACGKEKPRGPESLVPERPLLPTIVEPSRLPLRRQLLAHIDSLVWAGGSGSRVVFTEGNRWSVDYIEREMKRAWVTPERQTFSVARRNGSTDQLVNVIARVKGASDSVLVLCAHIDASASRDPGWERNWSRMPAPGADDDATGVAVLLSLLDSLVHSGVPPHYSLVIAAVNGEERNPDYAGLSHHDGHHLGSRHLARILSRGDAPIRGVIAMDMVGWNPNGDYLPIFSSTSGAGLARELAATNDRLTIGLTIPKWFNSCPNSDNESFDRFGIPAVLLMEGCRPWTREVHHPPNPAYHTSRDRQNMVTLSIVEKVTRLLVAFVGGEVKPPA